MQQETRGPGRPPLPEEKKRGGRISVNLTAEEHEALSRVAAKRGESISDLVRRLVRRFLARAAR